MADLAIGDRVPSSLDISYQRYASWCQTINCQAASYGAWLRAQSRSANSVAGPGIVFQTPQQAREWHLAHPDR